MKQRSVLRSFVSGMLISMVLLSIPMASQGTVRVGGSGSGGGFTGIGGAGAFGGFSSFGGFGGLGGGRRGGPCCLCDPGPCPPDPLEGMREMMRLKEALSPSQPVYSPGQPEPKVDVKKDEHGQISEVKNLTGEEVRLADGLILGPRASLDPRGGGRILSGYVIRNRIKYTAEGIVENSTERIALLDELEEPIVLGPRAALTGKGRILSGYIIFRGRKYRAGENMEPIGQYSALPQGTVAMIQYATVSRSPHERAVIEVFEAFLEASYANGKSIAVKGAKLVMVSPTHAQITGTVTTFESDGNGKTSERVWEFKKQGTRWRLVRETPSPPQG